MTRFLLGAAAAAAIVSQPAFAADLAGGADIGHRSGAFAGATLRIGLDGHRPEEARPRLALGIGRIHERVSDSLRVERVHVPGFELAIGRGGRPQFLIGGHSLERAERRLGFTATHAVLAAAGIAAATFALVELTDDGPRDEPHMCLLPERELCR